MTLVDLGLPLPSLLTAPDRVAAPESGPLRDTFGRVVRDLRVSVTDRCNLRCTYCMPAEGLDWLPSEAVLSTSELIRILTVAVRDLGIESIRFTGGEPLLRRDLETVIAALSALHNPPDIAMTTNGLGLVHRAQGLVDAGLRRINVSLDTVDPARFAEVTRRDRLDDVLAGLDAAHRAGLYPVKVNAVIPQRSDLAGLPALLRYCLDAGHQLRVIEQMPLDADRQWSRESMVTATEILEALSTAYHLLPDPTPRGGAPAETWLVDGFSDPKGNPARVGVIASVTRPFCGDCDRTRLTADGALRNCLFANSETSLISALRDPSITDTDAEIRRLWYGNAWAKRAGHMVNTADFRQPERPMSAIGG